MRRTTINRTVSIPKPLDARVKTYLRRQKRSMSDLVSEALRQYLALWGEIGLSEGKKPKKVPKGQEWIWTPKWQARIRQSLEDVREGRVKSFDNVEDLIRDLHQPR